MWGVDHSTLISSSLFTGLFRREASRETRACGVGLTPLVQGDKYGSHGF